MKQGTVFKLVHTFGSKWGRIRPSGEDREVFFHPASLDDPAEFDRLAPGQRVLFLEELDRANGSHAVQVKRDPQESDAVSTDEAGGDPVPLSRAAS